MSLDCAENNHQILTFSGGLSYDMHGAGWFVCNISEEPSELLEFPALQIEKLKQREAKSLVTQLLNGRIRIPT